MSQEAEVIEDRGDLAVEPEVEVEEKPEPKVEAVAEPEPKVEAAAEPEEVKTDDIQIPKQRLDTEIARRKQLEETLARLKKEQPRSDAPQIPEYDFDTKEKEYLQATWAGEEDKALGLRQEIRAAEAERYRHEAAQYANLSTTQAQQNVEFAQTVESLQNKYPIFNPESVDTYDKTLTDLALNLRDKFIASGQDPASSLHEAVDLTLAKYKPELLSTAVASKPVQGVNIQEKVAAANQQPPQLSGDSSSSRGEPVIDITTLTPEEFGALPEATIKRLRGDTF